MKRLGVFLAHLIFILVIIIRLVIHRVRRMSMVLILSRDKEGGNRDWAT